VAIGNHDLYTALDQGFGTVFPLAADGQGTRRTWGAVTCGNVLFLALDSNAPGDAAQLAFLDAALAAARVDGRVDHVFPVFHHPPYSSGDYHGDDLIVRETFGARFADPASKVSLVFSGHEHVYERVRAGRVTYVVSGGGGAALYGQGAPTTGATSLAFAAAHHYVVVTVTGRHVDVRAASDQGAALDAFAYVAPAAPPGADAGPPPAAQPALDPGGCGAAPGRPGAGGARWVLAALALAVALSGSGRLRSA